MENLQIQAKVRAENAGTPDQIRKAGNLPAVVYGNKQQTLSLTVNASEFEKIFKRAGESTIVELVTEDGKKRPVLIHDVQIHFLTSKPTHIDFLEVSMTERLKAKVALEFVGTAPAVKELSGVLMKVVNEVEVECLPTDLPHNIEVDISSLKTFDKTIHLKDIKAPARVQILGNPEEVIAKVQPPRNVEAELTAEVKEDVEAVMAASEKPKEAAEGEEAEQAEEKK